MSKKTVDGDVLGNKWSLMAAKSQKILLSMMGPEPGPAPVENASKADEQDQDEDLRVNFGHDRLGVGGYLPKDIADGSFTRRAPTSNDKLLEQLIGKKRAKAHIAAKQEAERAAAREQPQLLHPLGRPAPAKKEESEDEEEGRAATFKSKRRKTDQVASPPADKDEPKKEVSGATGADEPTDTSEAEEAAIQPEGNSDDEIPKKAKRPRKARAKPTSYLDEVLAERTKKKNKKNQA